MNVGNVESRSASISGRRFATSTSTPGRTKIWDTCAPEAILHGAGGKMTDVDGAPLVYDRECLQRRGIVASTARCAFVIETLAPLVRTTD